MNLFTFFQHFVYLFMEVYIIGAVTVMLWGFHFRFLWKMRGRILLGMALVCAYTLPMDALAVAWQWGGFNPAYVTGIAFFHGTLHLEEIVFWLGTSMVTISAVMIFAELQRRGVPFWALPAGVIVPIDAMVSLFEPVSPHQRV